MNNKYRVDWQAGMRLTDEIFRSADEYYLSCLQPLYSVLVNGDYGFLSLPIFRYELSESTLSVTELEANAISYSGKLIPTCHRAHFKSIYEDEYYQTLMALLNEEQKQVISEKIKDIDKLQKAIERQLKNEQEYDVFISYKATDNNGDKTEDSVIAREIYEELNISVKCDGFVDKTIFIKDDKEITLNLYRCIYLSGEVVLSAHSSYIFVDKNLLLTYDLADADVELAKRVVNN